MMHIHLKSKYINEPGTIDTAHYADGQTALLFAPDTGEPAWALSVNLMAYSILAPEGYVYIKGYSEGEGLCEALVKAGVVSEPINTVAFGPYDATAELVEVLA